MKIYVLILCSAFLTLGCTGFEKSTTNDAELQSLKFELDSLKAIQSQRFTVEGNQIATFLTFQKDDAEEAMNFYVELFNNSKIVEVKRWGKDAPGKEGSIMHATFHLNGAVYMCSDSPPIHNWDFTPAVSNYVECSNASELKRLFTQLSTNGTVLMPLNNYGFSEQFGFVKDRFGVSWQLNLK